MEMNVTDLERKLAYQQLINCQNTHPNKLFKIKHSLMTADQIKCHQLNGWSFSYSV